MTRPSIEQLQKDFLDMDIPSIGDPELLGDARRLYNLFQMFKRETLPPGFTREGVEASIRASFDVLEAEYASAVFAQTARVRTFVEETGTETPCTNGPDTFD